MDLAELESRVADDQWMMQVLAAAEDMGLHDWWIGAGFLRNAVWDWMSGHQARHDSDVDLVYFDADNCRPEMDWRLEEEAKRRFPFANWEIRNQARMHEMDGASPYSSTQEGISHWVETATCIAVRREKDKLEFLFCYGVDDLFGMVARPIPGLSESGDERLFWSRFEKKKWLARWPQLIVWTGSDSSQS